ncbi:MAG: radical SAM protein [Rhodospirillales bacterium]|nr:radical SAM protein [Rhodospirillales bacterium]
MTASPDHGPPFEAAYQRLHASGELKLRARRARRHLTNCDLCACYCRVDRTASVKGAACRTGEKALVSSFGPHYGEETPLVGRCGSGTIFFGWCNLRCLFCQNWDISWRGEGREMEAREIAAIMLHLQDQGCHNINFVSPSHVVAHIIEAVSIAVGAGLRLPIVYNTGGYDSPEALELLDGIVDIYMPDMKFEDSDVARRLSKIRDYAPVNKAAIREMFRQVGDLRTDPDGIATRGLLVRHLVMPNGLAGTRAIMWFLAKEISPDTYVNVMAQYRPCHRAHEQPDIARPPTPQELAEAVRAAQLLGLRLDGG